MTNNLAPINEISQTAIRQRMDMVDQATFAFITKQFDYLLSIGEDPTQYEVTLESQDGVETTHDGYRIMSRIGLRKIEDNNAQY